MIQNLVNSEKDEDSSLNHINSPYYDEKKFNSLKHDIPSSFSLFHANIASLNKHIDDLRLILSRLKHKFDVIGISEHKIRKDTVPSNNITIPGYNEFIFEPTETTHGGTGFYIRDNIDYTMRTDLQLNSPGDFDHFSLKFNLLRRKI